MTQERPEQVPASLSFFQREALELAYHLIEATLVAGEVSVRITEVEAYRATGDSANHARFGLTKRNGSMFGPPGHAYIYLCYGVHWMLNVVSDEPGKGAAVLIRSAEVLHGGELVAQRRKSKVPWSELPLKARALLTAGPGRLGQALALHPDMDGRSLMGGGAMTLCPPKRAPTSFRVGPRVGIQFALPEHVRAPWRIASGHSECVSVPKELGQIIISESEWERGSLWKEPL